MKFSEWLDNVLKQDISEDAVAVNFNLYEEGDGEWSVQMIAADTFDEENDDWACEEVFSTEEDLYIFHKDGDWTKALPEAIELVEEYLDEGKYSGRLKEFDAVGIGFVDGDIDILYKKED